mgnify:CR=1 FL=1
MQPNTSSASDSLRAGNRVVAFGIAAIVLVLLGAAVFLFLNLPDANAFNARVERLFIENDNLTTGAEIKLLEILAQSGTSFSEVLTSYRSVIFVLLVFATALLIASLVFLVTIVALNRRLDAAPLNRFLWGVAVVDDRRRLLYGRNADRLFVPASNTKLVVTATAAALLPLGIVWEALLSRLPEPRPLNSLALTFGLSLLLLDLDLLHSEHVNNDPKNDS